MFDYVEHTTATRLGLIDGLSEDSRIDVKALRAQAFLDAAPSERILLAVDDIEAAERSPHYAVEMTTWHAPDHRLGVCAVCLAGAVLASRHPIRPHQVYVGPFDAEGPGEYSTSAHWDRILSSLDDLRNGYVDGYLLDDGRLPDDVIENFISDHGPSDLNAPFPGYVSYEENPAAFKAWARDVAGKLATIGY